MPIYVNKYCLQSRFMCILLCVVMYTVITVWDQLRKRHELGLWNMCSITMYLLHEIKFSHETRRIGTESGPLHNAIQVECKSMFLHIFRFFFFLLYCISLRVCIYIFCHSALCVLSWERVFWFTFHANCS